MQVHLVCASSTPSGRAIPHAHMCIMGDGDIHLHLESKQKKRSRRRMKYSLYVIKVVMFNNDMIKTLSCRTMASTKCSLLSGVEL